MMSIKILPNIKGAFMLKKSLILSLALASALSANDVRFELGGASGDGKAKTADVIFNFDSSGFTSKLRLGYTKHDNGKAYGVDSVFGWKFGDAGSWGAFKIYPLGLGYTYYKHDKEILVNVNSGYRYYKTDNLNLFIYKAGVEYQKDNLLIDNLSLVLGAFYNHTFRTSSFDDDSEYYSDLSYKPKGFETYVGLDYLINDKFIVGAKAGYNKFTDSSFDDKAFFNQKGATFKLNFGYKF